MYISIYIPVRKLLVEFREQGLNQIKVSSQCTLFTADHIFEKMLSLIVSGQKFQFQIYKLFENVHWN